MKQKKISVLLKSYFYFTQQERKGIIPLLVLLLSLIIIPELYARVFGDKLAYEKLEQIKDTILSASDYLDVQHKEQLGAQKFQRHNFPFDSIRRRNKVIYPIDLNTADSETIVGLYRIGPGMTHRILEFRQQLGGFVSINQLKEIWGFDEDILYDLKGKIEVGKSTVKKFHINQVSMDELQTHPYFKFKLSRTIINYRNQHGPFAQLSDLRNIPVIDDSVFQRITMYLIP